MSGALAKSSVKFNTLEDTPVEKSVKKVQVENKKQKQKSVKKSKKEVKDEL